ncbi:MAG: hypothetical protein MnENMB40S_06820 [Rhizobiaceae bacterium MnEN-MB40S]|nr:MAG: hypothetical protein MnENMB40S_06820 [Rhizobiaceae bacterium MnEN-MB40S]
MKPVFAPGGKIASAAIAALIVSASFAPAEAEIRASVSQNQVILGEPFRLSIQVEGASGNAQPDLGPLSKNFTVEGTGQTSQTSIINGHTTVSQGWTVTLTPKSPGKVEIPAIKVGAEQSKPIVVDVVDAASLPKTSLAQSGVEVDMQAAPGPYYVQQEIPVTVRITSSGGLRSAQLSDLSGPDLIVTRRGEDKVSQVTRNGQPVSVIERDYMVKPQKSGNFTLGPLVLRGAANDPNGRRSPFGNNSAFAQMRQQFGFSGFGNGMFDDFFSPTKSVTVRSNAIQIDVSANPAGQSDWFLPAKAVELKQSWQPDHPDFQVGEAVTRVDQIVALGASKEMLPDIDFQDVDGASVYVDRVDDRSADTDKGTAAIKQYMLSVVPTRGGAVTLPEIQVEWFDTVAGEQKTSTLPAQTIEVAGGAASTMAPASTPAVSAPQAGNRPPTTRNANLAALAEQADWRYVSGAGVALLLAVALAIALVRRRRTATAPSVARTAHSKRGSVETVARRREKQMAESARAFRDACRRGDASQAYHQFGLWALAAGYDIDTARSAGAGALKKELGKLEARIFGGEASGSWKGSDLLAAFDAVASQGRKPAAAKREIAPLYPQNHDGGLIPA